MNPCGKEVTFFGQIQAVKERGRTREKYVAKRLRIFFLSGNKVLFRRISRDFFGTHRQMNVVCLASKCSGLLKGNIDID